MPSSRMQKHRIYERQVMDVLNADLPTRPGAGGGTVRILNVGAITHGDRRVTVKALPQDGVTPGAAVVFDVDAKTGEALDWTSVSALLSDPQAALLEEDSNHGE
jgi:hypothetical protein